MRPAEELFRAGEDEMLVEEIMQHQDGVRSVKAELLEALHKLTASADAHDLKSGLVILLAPASGSARRLAQAPAVPDEMGRLSQPHSA